MSTRFSRRARIALRGLGLLGIAGLLTGMACSDGCGDYGQWTKTGVEASVDNPTVCPVSIPTRTSGDLKNYSGTIKLSTAQAAGTTGQFVYVNFTNQNNQNVNGQGGGAAASSALFEGRAYPSGTYTAGTQGPQPGETASVQWDKSTATVPTATGRATGWVKLPYSFATVASVTGPGSGVINTPYTYTASVKSGKYPYRYEWYIDGIKKTGTQSSYVYSGLTGTHSIRVDVWDVENDKGSATTTVSLGTGSGGGGSSPPPCDPGSGGGNPVPFRAAPPDGAGGGSGSGSAAGTTPVAPRPMNQLPLPPC